MAATVTTTSIVAPTIAREIREHHEAAHSAARSALEHARLAGEKLAEAKANILHGEWLRWLAEHLPDISETTARGYMRVASRWAELQTGNGVADLPLRDALKVLSEPKAKTTTGGENVITTAAPDPELSRRRGVYATSRQSTDQPNRIVEITVATARDLLADVFDPQTDGQTINVALLDGTDPALRPIWAAELRTVLRELRMVISALEGARRD